MPTDESLKELEGAVSKYIQSLTPEEKEKVAKFIGKVMKPIIYASLFNIMMGNKNNEEGQNESI